MSNLRFVLAAAALFGFAFAGISFGMPWASKGFPVFAARTAPPNMDRRAAPTTGDSVHHDDRKVGRSEAPQGDNDAGRNRMRLTAVQTATAYAQSPCEQAIKAAFVVAASTYLRAASGKDAEHAFSTPMDVRVRESIAAAFDSGGLTGDEFPTGLWTAPAAKSRGSSVAPCASSAALSHH